MPKIIFKVKELVEGFNSRFKRSCEDLQFSLIHIFKEEIDSRNSHPTRNFSSMKFQKTMPIQPISLVCGLVAIPSLEAIIINESYRIMSAWKTDSYTRHSSLKLPTYLYTNSEIIGSKYLESSKTIISYSPTDLNFIKYRHGRLQLVKHFKTANLQWVEPCLGNSFCVKHQAKKMELWSGSKLVKQQEIPVYGRNFSPYSRFVEKYQALLIEYYRGWISLYSMSQRQEIAGVESGNEKSYSLYLNFSESEDLLFAWVAGEKIKVWKYNTPQFEFIQEIRMPGIQFVGAPN